MLHTVLTPEHADSRENINTKRSTTRENPAAPAGAHHELDGAQERAVIRPRGRERGRLPRGRRPRGRRREPRLRSRDRVARRTGTGTGRGGRCGGS